MAWLLITVTGDGQVNTFRHPTKREAEIAGSLAQYGKTPDEIEAQRKARHEWVEQQKAVYIAAHPPRPPTKEEKKRIETYGKDSIGGGQWRSGSTSGTSYWVGDLIQEVQWHDYGSSSGSYSSSKGEWADHDGVEFIIKNRSNVKTVRVIHEAEDGCLSDAPADNKGNENG